VAACCVGRLQEWNRVLHHSLNAHPHAGSGQLAFVLDPSVLEWRAERSLGTSSGNITKAQHCRPEVYIGGHGWVPVDPADVRKVVLEEPPGNRPLDDEMVRKARARLFGSWEMNWVAYNFAHDVALPGSVGAPVGFLMYPQAETTDGRLDSLAPDTFKYEIKSREIPSSNG
jgi:transglutaminase-like putative cysteine protease